MKYTSSNKPLICMQTQSSCYKGTSKMAVKGILWHSTGANNKTLKRYVQPSDTKPAEDTYSKVEWLNKIGTNAYKNDWNHIAKNAGLNAWIGTLANGEVTAIQTMPWDFKPWGCGSGAKGSCNDGWIQFEICEDALNDKVYFDKVYKEACELTAYLCKMFNIDPKGTVTHNGVKVPTILCHQDSYKLKLGSNHSDVLHWFKKFDKTMDNVRADVAVLMGATTAKEIYRVRTSWLNPVSQKGAFGLLENAIACCKEAGEGYKVFDSKGKVVYTYVSPIPSKIDVTYQVWDDVKNKWLPNVVNDSDYAGIFGNAVCAVYANLSYGNITYQVHSKNGKWYGEIKNREDYAGVFNKPIDAIRMKIDVPGKKIEYRVHIKGKNKWLGWISGYDINNSKTGYAGILGYEIDAIQIRVK